MKMFEQIFKKDRAPTQFKYSNCKKGERLKTAVERLMAAIRNYKKN